MNKNTEINRDPIENVIFDFIYDMALTDATRRTKAGLKEKIRNNDEVKRKVRDYAESVVSGKNPVHCEDVIEEIEKILEKKEITGFWFGNIQKLINMTMKYLYIRYYDDQNKQKNFECCDAPMDSIMRDRVKSYYKEKGWGKTGFDSETAWSKIGMDENNKKYKRENYRNYQKAVDRIIEEEYKETGQKWNKIEFDYRFWND